jgi:hypothetical protein
MEVRYIGVSLYASLKYPIVAANRTTPTASRCYTFLCDIFSVIRICQKKKNLQRASLAGTAVDVILYNDEFNLLKVLGVLSPMLFIYFLFFIFFFLRRCSLFYSILFARE